MSRNFELMTQLETELRKTNKPSDRVALMPVAFDKTSNAFREETLRLVQRVFLSATGNAPRQVVFCGVDGDGGSSAVCACTARTLAANSSLPVCIVDANVRSPHLADIFGINGIYSSPDASKPLLAQCVKVGDNLWLAGPDLLADDCRVLLPVDDLRRRFAELRDIFGYLLIDVPSTNISGDAQLLGQIADAAILVVEADRTRKLTARRAKEILDNAGVHLLGTVLHNRSFPVPESLYKRL